MPINVHFICPCGAIVEEEVDGAIPNLMSESIGDSVDQEWTSVICDGCGKDFDVCVTSSISGTDVDASGAIDLTWELPDPDEELIWEIESTDQLAYYQKVASDVISLLRSNYPSQAEYTLHTMLYAQVVTALEAYLSGVFIHTVVNSDELIRVLVETDPQIGKRKFSLAEIFMQWKGLKVEVARYLKDLIFHDLKKVKPMYKDVLGYDFGDVEWLFRAISIRHDCVHRNGRTKEGEYNDVDAESVRDLVEKCTSLVSSIDRYVSHVYSPV